MIDALGWIGTAAVLAGYALNSQQKYTYAMITWIIGDALWIAYDVLIANMPHCILSLCIIGLNIRGIVRITKQRRKEDKSYLDV
jgi:hypothetical protein